LQEQASNRPVLLRSKGVVVSDRVKVTQEGWQVSVEKMNESEPTEDASLLRRRCQNWGRGLTPGSVEAKPVYGLGGSRCIGGMISTQAQAWNVRT
jgi:hypothetical protein